MTKFHHDGINVPPTASEAEAHSLARRVLQTGAERVALDFRRPDDDWDPMWLVLTDEKGTLVTPGHNVEKYQMVAYVAKLAQRWGAVAIGHLHSSWMVTDPAAVQLATDRDGVTEGLPRDEVLLIATYTAGNARQCIAAIERHDDAPPTLAPFAVMVDTSSDELSVSGAMVDPLIRALAKVG